MTLTKPGRKLKMHTQILRTCLQFVAPMHVDTSVDICIMIYCYDADCGVYGCFKRYVSVSWLKCVYQYPIVEEISWVLEADTKTCISMCATHWNRFNSHGTYCDAQCCYLYQNICVLYRYAKRNLDDRAFYGGILSVCYAPEMESVAETRAKLVQRRKDIAKRTRGEVASCTLQGKLIKKSSIASSIVYAD
jgi:hypothetical protein